MSRFSFSDTLLFYSIAYESTHKGIATLSGIFSAEDAINRSAPTFEEMKNGINFLLSAKLITHHGNGFTLTAEGEQLYSGANQGNATVFKRLEDLKQTLRSRFSGIRVEQAYDLDPADFQQAYNAYYGAT